LPIPHNTKSFFPDLLFLPIETFILTNTLKSFKYAPP
jgi:hypothetical protein